MQFISGPTGLLVILRTPEYDGGMSREATTGSTGRKKASTCASNRRQLVYTLNTRDVILGRGQHVKQEGNRQFVALVRSKVVDYNNTSQETFSKDTVARQVMKEIETLGGRFVRKAGCTESKSASGMDGSNSGAATSAWEIVDEASILVKIKQTFRDYSVIQRRAAATASEGTNGGSTRNPPFQDSHVAVHHPSGVTMLQSYFQTDAVYDHRAQQTPQQPSALGLPSPTRQSMPINPSAATAVPLAPPPPPAPPIPNDILRQALDALIQKEQQRQLLQLTNEHTRLQSVPQASWLTQSLHSSQPVPIAPSAPPVESLIPPPPVETLETGVLREAIDVWLQNEQQLEQHKQSQQLLLHQILALESHRTEPPPRQPVPFGRPLAPPPRIATLLSQDRVGPPTEEGQMHASAPNTS